MAHISSLADVLALFAESEPVQANPKLLANTRTALTKYCLPQLEKLEPLDQQSSKLMLRITELFQSAYEKSLTAGKSKGTLNNYKSAIQRFDQWSRKQNWYASATGTQMNKVCLPMSGGNYYKRHRRSRKAQPQYQLKGQQWTAHLKTQLEAFRKWSTQPEVRTRKQPALRQETWQSHAREVQRFMGWLHNIQKQPLESLSLAQLCDVDLLSDYIAWHINERGSAYRSMELVCNAASGASKFLYGQASRKVDYSDIEEVNQINLKRQYIIRKGKKQKDRIHLNDHLVPFEQILEVVQFLKDCKAPYYHTGQSRSLFAQIRSWQQYLIVAILTYCPVRQRELRELELGKTLFREQNGYWVKLLPEGHKNGSKTGKGREYPLPEQITQDLDDWLEKIRSQVHTDHSLVFIQVGNSPNSKPFGQPTTDATIRAITTAATFRALEKLGYEPKGVRPHDFRRIAVTFQRRYGRPEQDEALAELMGHSKDQANRVYSQVTSREKTQKATEWWKSAS
ncbi:tyrosine-type recombinase/integrase [Spirulina major]|uniref:tyrosine-type recombinase/integrase n=1 Tax=Spirulina major TaxID=270636 RepID=UPI0009324393|nr:site-specific integrase [Spirulina major]